MFTKLILIFIGGGVGAAIRESFILIALTLHNNFPLGILAANLIAAFLIGLVTVLTAKNTRSDRNIQLFTVTGIMGGLSTFSTLIWGTLMLWQEQRQYWIGWLYLLISMGSGLVMVELGTRWGKVLARSSPQ